MSAVFVECLITSLAFRQSMIDHRETVVFVWDETARPALGW